MDKTDEFEKYLKDGIMVQDSIPKEVPATTNEGKESIEQMIENLQNNIKNCESLIQSGKVKDINRKDSLLIMIN